MPPAKKQHFKEKFLNWGPIQIWHNLTCVHIFCFKSLHPTVELADLGNFREFRHSTSDVQ